MGLYPIRWILRGFEKQSIEAIEGARARLVEQLAFRIHIFEVVALQSEV